VIRPDSNRNGSSRCADQSSCSVAQNRPTPRRAKRSEVNPGAAAATHFVESSRSTPLGFVSSGSHFDLAFRARSTQAVTVAAARTSGWL